MYFIGLDVHKKTISYCVKDAAGKIHQEGKIGSTRRELDAWIKTLPQPRMMAMEATIFTGWIYDHLVPHAEKVKVAHPLMLRAIAAAKRKNDKIDASKIAGCLRCDFLDIHVRAGSLRGIWPIRDGDEGGSGQDLPNGLPDISYGSAAGVVAADWILFMPSLKKGCRSSRSSPAGRAFSDAAGCADSHDPRTHCPH